jgi:hypothetical protein
LPESVAALLFSPRPVVTVVAWLSLGLESVSAMVSVGGWKSV